MIKFVVLFLFVLANLTKLNENGFRDIVLIGLKIILKKPYNPIAETFNSNVKCDIYINKKL
ncbi:MAG: hypothetical protein Q8888_02105 [Vigna little leaf phytoplasma]|nr:hypothetical protein [Vigna little leaf phytoplasma]